MYSEEEKKLIHSELIALERALEALQARREKVFTSYREHIERKRMMELKASASKSFEHHE